MPLPIVFTDSLKDVPGYEAGAFQDVHESAERVTSIRLNPLKFSSRSVKDEMKFDDASILLSPVPWSSFGYYLSGRPLFTLDPLIHAGAYYVQEASSMFLEEALRQTVDLSQPLKVLDLCAAPGGKSTLLQSLISHNSLLVSNEVIRSRAGILQENLVKWGGRNVVVTNNDAKDFGQLENYFDVMVVDAPCSGSGLFRRDPEAIEEWSPANVELCSQRQKRILGDAVASLKKGGMLIYSTCSYSAQEDEDILDWAVEELSMDSLSLHLKSEWNIVETRSPVHKAYGYRFYPDKVKGEGFFIGVLQKGEGNEVAGHSARGVLQEIAKKEYAVVQEWINGEDDSFLMKQADEVLAIPIPQKMELPLLQKHLYIRQAGIKMGKITHGELVPDHALALSRLVNEKIASVSLNKPDALQYLRKADVLIDGIGKGWALVKYKGLNLGWIKGLGNRINNYYPKDWRILMR